MIDYFYLIDSFIRYSVELWIVTPGVLVAPGDSFDDATCVRIPIAHLPYGVLEDEAVPVERRSNLNFILVSILAQNVETGARGGAICEPVDHGCVTMFHI